MLPVEGWTNCKGWVDTGQETLQRGKGFKRDKSNRICIVHADRLRLDLLALGSSIVSMTYCKAVFHGVDYNYPVSADHINIKCVCQAHNIMNSICNPGIQFNNFNGLLFTIIVV